MSRGDLRIYLGAAPGVGKTYAMLGEAHRRAERGTDVVIGFVETHGRRHTASMVDDLEVVPRRQVRYRGSTFEEMDTAAILERAPEVVLVDELAHTNVPGGRHEKRWEDVEELLHAGIDVVSTLNIQHLESLNDVVSSITGIKQRETIPDDVARRADQLELVDMAPEALRRRMAHGNVYAAEKVDAALGNYFRVGNLSALRELALLWLADRVDEGLEKYRVSHGITATWPTRERVVVALTGGPEGETLIRHAARLAARGAGGELLAVYVSRSDGLTGASPQVVAGDRKLVESVGGTFVTVVGDDAAAAVLDYAHGINASQIVIGASRRGRVRALFSRGVGDAIIDGSGDIAVQVVTHEHVARRLGGSSTRRTALPRGRRVAGWILAVVGPIALTALLSLTQDTQALPTELLLLLALTVGVALVGGRSPALVCAVLSSVLANYFFTEPRYTLTISEPENVVALVVFVVVGVAVASVVDMAARRSTDAARAQTEADVLAQLAGSVLRGEAGLDALLARAVETFSMESATLLERDDEHAPWRCVASSGPGDPCGGPGDADASVPAGDDRVLALRGRVLPASDQKVLAAFAAQAGEVIETERLRRTAAGADDLAEGNRVRTALLAAVSHDLRTPLAGIKAASSGLRHDAVELSEDDRAELLATIEDSADRLDRLVANLLDLSRLQTGAVSPLTRTLTLDGVVAAALVGTAEVERVTVDVPEDLPAVVADPGLLERVVANVVENAVRYAGSTTVLGSALGDRVELRIVDAGPGVADAAKPTMFAPFQRLGDAPSGNGVGLGLAVARGLTEVMGGTLDAEDTPGGGLTVVLSLPAAPRSPTTPAVAEAGV